MRVKATIYTSEVRATLFDNIHTRKDKRMKSQYHEESLIPHSFYLTFHIKLPHYQFHGTLPTDDYPYSKPHRHHHHQSHSLPNNQHHHHIITRIVRNAQYHIIKE